MGLLAAGTFIMGTDAFVIAGVLPGISASFDISTGQAGQLVTVFSLSYAALAPVLAALTGSWSRRRVLTTALVVFAVGNAVTALAPSYGLVLGSRVVAAGGAALYTANASATASMLAGEHQRGRALSIVMLGLTSSLILGAPLGTALGSVLDWRATMWFVTAMAVLVAPLILWRIPKLHSGGATALRRRFVPLSDRRVLAVLATTVVVFTGIYVPYTYISAVYQPATGDHGGRLAVLLLVFGTAGTAGNLMAGYLADRVGPMRVITVGTVALAAVLLGVPVLRETFATALVAVVLCGVFSFSVTTPQQHMIIALAPGERAVVTSLYQAALYFAVSLSGVVGAFGLGTNVVGARYLSVLAAVFVLAATVLTRVSVAKHTQPEAGNDGWNHGADMRSTET
ncbi:DHA1 family inner membrane transport protein [Haloactinospora alba]|uniref:DHA1 family inner membrane transport protein n=1 Tax=Haloactinospora alba TaxID=405555 RepID=A0A543NA67_9ACTN|nr:DHA1 family inner membrane transport protein [Haloactinospora alba]